MRWSTFAIPPFHSQNLLRWRAEENGEQNNKYTWAMFRLWKTLQHKIAQALQQLDCKEKKEMEGGKEAKSDLEDL